MSDQSRCGTCGTTYPGGDVCPGCHPLIVASQKAEIVTLRAALADCERRLAGATHVIEDYRALVGDIHKRTAP